MKNKLRDKVCQHQKNQCWIKISTDIAKFAQVPRSWVKF